MFCSHYDMLEKSLVKRGFIVHQAKDANEAKQLAFSLIKPNESVGFGGSERS
jgi:L-lactate utilization protein LutB